MPAEQWLSLPTPPRSTSSASLLTCTFILEIRPCNSPGGREDHLLDLTLDLHAEVFPDEEDVAAAGYESNTQSDLVAASDAIRVGMPANPIRHLQRLQGRESFGEIQRRQDAERAARLTRARAKAAASAARSAAQPDTADVTAGRVVLAS
jgi:hypothetical protein